MLIYVCEKSHWSYEGFNNFVKMELFFISRLEKVAILLIKFKESFAPELPYCIPYS